MILSHGTCEPDFALRCWSSQQAYADRIGVPFKRVIIPPQRFPQEHKLSLLAQHCGDAQRVLYLDWDMEICANAESVFEKFTDGIFVFDEPCKKPKIFGKHPCTALMLLESGLVRQILPTYQRRYNTINHSAPDWMNEEFSFKFALNMFGKKFVEVRPSGFIHHIGRSKWNDKQEIL